MDCRQENRELNLGPRNVEIHKSKSYIMETKAHKEYPRDIGMK